VLRGGTGDDTYHLWDISAAPQEHARRGTDTLYVHFEGGMVMPDHVENLVLAGPGAVWATGNTLANRITAGVHGATIDGGAGKDLLFGGAGSDVFVIKAGNGSDTIFNFKPGMDVISLQGYGVTSFEALMSKAHQALSNVAIALPNGERLMIKGVAMSDLRPADFGFPAVEEPAGDDWTFMAGGGKTIVQNGVYVSNNVWGKGDLVEGVDFHIDSTFHWANLTDGTTFNWGFPATTDPYAPVRGYPDIIFGVAPYGDLVNATDTTRTFPVRLSSIEDLTATFETQIGGNTSGFNVAFDIWLTRTPNGGPDAITNEIMIWTHDHAFMPWGDLIGTYPQGSASAQIYHTGTYTAVIMDKDMLAGTLDLGAVFARLEELGVVSQNEWLASVQFGAEVISGSGSLTVDRFELALETKDQAGTLTSKLIDGTGTRIVELTAADEAVAPQLHEALFAQHDDSGLHTDSSEADTILFDVASSGTPAIADAFVGPNGAAEAANWRAYAASVSHLPDGLGVEAQAATLVQDLAWAHSELVFG
jgi:hypothetical protein